MQSWLVTLCVAQTGRIYDIPGCMSLAEPCKLQSCQIAGSEPWGTNWNCFERMFFCGGHEIRVCAPNIWLLHNTVILGEEPEANSPCHQRNSSSPKRSVSSIEASKHFAYTHNSQVLKVATFKDFAPTRNLACLLHVAVNSAQWHHMPAANSLTTWLMSVLFCPAKRTPHLNAFNLHGDSAKYKSPWQTCYQQRVYNAHNTVMQI